MDATLNADRALEADLKDINTLPDAGASNAPAEIRSSSDPSAVKTLPSLSEVISQPAVKRLMPGLVGGLAFLLVVLFWWSMTSTPYRSISDGMVSSDIQLAYEALQSGDYNSQINPSTGQLEVPNDKYQSARIFLASQGIPKASIEGGMSSLSDSSSMTTSQFMEQVQYNSALENELARTIAQIGTIDSVRVHLAAPKQSVFVRDRQPAKASVIVRPFRGRSVDESQVQSIVHLVSSSVPYLSIQDVTVVDHYGNLLTNNNADGNGLPALNNARFEDQREKELAARVMDLLVPALGGGNIRTVVNLELDFTQRESTFEQYYDAEDDRPEIRSEVITSDTQTGISASGVPGGTTNIPPDEAEVVPEGELPDNPANTSTATTSREQTTRNYELDKEIRLVKEQTGSITSMTAGVMINEDALRTLAERIYRKRQTVNVGQAINADNEAESDGENSIIAESRIPESELKPIMASELEKFRTLVLTALPYDADRGDVINISSTPFFVDPPQEYSLPWHKDDSVIEWGRHAMTSLALIAFLFLVVSPMLRAYLPSKEAEDLLLAEELGEGELSAADKQALEDGESLDEIKAKLKPKRSAISADMLDTANSYDDKVAIVRLLVAEDAGRVANVLKRMINPA